MLFVFIISKLFILDFYTLADKITKNDIGGTMFVHTTCKDNFILKAKDTIYKYIENNIYGDRTQKLPTVMTLEVTNVISKPFTYLTNKKDNNAYEVTLVWTYDEDMGYQTETKIILVHEGKKLSIVQMD